MGSKTNEGRSERHGGSLSPSGLPTDSPALWSKNGRAPSPGIGRALQGGRAVHWLLPRLPLQRDNGWKNIRVESLQDKLSSNPTPPPPQQHARTSTLKTKTRMSWMCRKSGASRCKLWSRHCPAPVENLGTWENGLQSRSYLLPPVSS